MNTLDIFADGKICNTCGIWKMTSNFYSTKRGLLKCRPSCKPCDLARVRQRNALPEVKAKRSAYDKSRESDPSVRLRRNELRRSPERKAKIREYWRKRLRNDPAYATAERARGMIHRTLAAVGTSKALPTFDLLGYGPEKLMDRLSCQFRPGMGWDNHGDWHIDHKKPLTAFVSQGETRPHIINALCNLQPLWGPENMSKNSKWPYIRPDNDNIPRSEAA